MANKQIITPKGIFKYTHLNSPDTKGAEMFGGDPQYKVTMVLDKDDPETQKLLEKMEALHKEAYEQGVAEMDEANAKAKAAWKKKGISEPNLNDFYDDEFDENDEPTGRIELKFKTKAQFKDRKTGKVVKKTVPFIDGNGQTIPTSKRPLVYGGSEGRVAFATNSVFIPKDADVYLGLYLNSVQITKLETSGGGNPFGADEDSDFTSDDLEDYTGGGDDEGEGDDDDGFEGDSGNNPPDDGLDDDEIPF